VADVLPGPSPLRPLQHVDISPVENLGILPAQQSTQLRTVAGKQGPFLPNVSWR